jgi:hypothetical protein
MPQTRETRRASVEFSRSEGGGSFGVRDEFGVFGRVKLAHPHPDQALRTHRRGHGGPFADLARALDRDEGEQSLEVLDRFHRRDASGTGAGAEAALPEEVEPLLRRPDRHEPHCKIAALSASGSASFSYSEASDGISSGRRQHRRDRPGRRTTTSASTSGGAIARSAGASIMLRASCSGAAGYVVLDLPLRHIPTPF